MNLIKTLFLTTLSLFLVFALFAHPALAKEVHHEYEWWTPSLIPPPPDFASCPACHESLAVSVTGHSRLRKNCEDCHLLGRSGPFAVYEPARLHLKSNYSAPMVYNHIANTSDQNIIYIYSTDLIEIADQSNAANGLTSSSCFGWNPETGQGTCHGISNESPVDGYFAFNIPGNPALEGPGPFRSAVEAENLPDTTNCLYCHMQSDEPIRSAWGGPNQTDSSHFDSSQNQDCYECHVEEGIILTTFHVMGPEPEVIYITTTTTTTTTTVSTSTTSLTVTTVTLTEITLPTTTLTLPSTTHPPETTPVPSATTSTTTPPQSNGIEPLYPLAGVAFLLSLVVILYVLTKKKRRDPLG